jgi:hypothetical protein
MGRFHEPRGRIDAKASGHGTALRLLLPVPRRLPLVSGAELERPEGCARVEGAAARNLIVGDYEGAQMDADESGVLHERGARCASMDQSRQ